MGWGDGRGLSLQAQVLQEPLLSTLSQVQIHELLPSGGLFTTALHGRSCQIDCAAHVHRVEGAVHAMQCQLRTFVQYRHGDEVRITCSPGAVAAWEEAVVVAVNGAALHAADLPTLRQLYAEGVIDPSLWTPPCKNEQLRALDVPHEVQREWYRALQDDFLTTCFGVAVGTPEGEGGGASGSAPRWSRMRSAGPRPDGRSRRAAAAESRFTDGLEAPAAREDSYAFFEAGYRAEVGTIVFCLGLADNPCQLTFGQAALAVMCADAVMKVRELQRQHVKLSALHIVPIYVYTYELEVPPVCGP